MYRLQQMQKQAEKAKITAEFSQGYPAYQEILEKYTKSAIFAGRSRPKEQKDPSTTEDNYASVQSSSEPWVVRG